VLQADGGTRTASITGAWLALMDAVSWMQGEGFIVENPVREPVAAISVGMFEGRALLDLDYQEDSGCETDMNLVMTAAGSFVEIQGTAEGAPFSPEHLQAMLALGKKGTQELMRLQALALQG